MEVKVIGIDIAKRYFQVHAVDASGAAILRRKLSREGFWKLMQSLPASLVGLEAGSAAHFWARELIGLGHEVRLMPPQFVRPYVKTNKNDAADAEACCEAVQRPGMRFVPVKSADQQAAMALHRVRDHLVRQRTGTINALRGHLAEHGIVASALRGGLNKLFAVIETTEDHGLPQSMKELLSILVTEIRDADARIADLDRKIKNAAKADDACRRLIEVPGIGPVIATAVVAAVPNKERFSSGRHFAAWLGLTPRQHSSGGTGSANAATLICADSSLMVLARSSASRRVGRADYGTGSMRSYPAETSACMQPLKPKLSLTRHSAAIGVHQEPAKWVTAMHMTLVKRGLAKLILLQKRFSPCELKAFESH